MLDSDERRARVENPHHDLLAEEAGQRRYAKVDRAILVEHQLEATVLRDALLGDVQLGDHLDPRRDFFLDHQRRLRDLDERAVEAVADPVELLERLEVDVGGTRRDRVEQDFLDIADDRCVVDFGRIVLAGCRGRQLVQVDLEILGRHQRRQRGVALFDDLGDRLRKLRILDDDRVDDEVGLEPDLFESLEVRQVGRRDEQPVAALVQWKDPAQDQDLGVHPIARDLREVERIQVEQRDAERPRREFSQFHRRHPLADQNLVNERAVRRRCVVLQLLRLRLGQQAVLDERAGEAAELTGSRIGCHRQTRF